MYIILILRPLPQINVNASTLFEKQLTMFATVHAYLWFYHSINGSYPHSFVDELILFLMVNPQLTPEYSNRRVLVFMVHEMVYK